MSRNYLSKRKLISFAAAALIAGNVVIADTISNGNTFDADSWQADTNVTVVDSTGGSVDFILNDTNDTLDIDAGYEGKAILEWNKLSIDADRILNFDGTDSVYLNKVTGSDVSNILGTIGGSTSATVIIVNPNGIVLGNGADIQINDIAFSTDDVTSYNGVSIDNNASNIGADLSLYDVSVNQDASSITIQNGASISSSGIVVLQNTNGIIEVNSSIQNADNIYIGGEGGTSFVLDENGSLGAVNEIDIDVDGNVTLNSDISSGNNIYITANGDIATVDSKISTTTLEMDATGDVSVDTSIDNLQVDHASNLEVANDKAINVISVGVDNTVGISAVGDITSDSEINASDVTLDASGNDIGAQGSEVEVNADHLTLRAGNAYVKSSADVNITEADITTTLYIDAAGNVTQNQENNISTSNLEVKAENIDLEQVNANTIVISADNATVNNQNAVSGDSEFNVDGTLVLTSGGDIGAVDNSVDLNATSISIDSNGHDIYLNLTGDTRNGTINGGTGNLAVTGAGHDLGEDTQNFVNISAGSVTLDGIRNAALNDLGSTEFGDINVTGSFGYVRNGDLTLDSNITANDIYLQANSITQASNNLQAGNNVELNATGNIDLTSVNSVGLTVTSSEGNVTLNGVNVSYANLNAAENISGSLYLVDDNELSVNAQNVDLQANQSDPFDYTLNLGNSNVADTYKLTTDAIEIVSSNGSVVRADVFEVNATGNGYISNVTTDINTLKTTGMTSATVNNGSSDLEVNSTDSEIQAVTVTADSLSFTTLNNDIAIYGNINEVNLSNVNGTVYLSNTKDLNVYADNKDLVISGGNVSGDVNFQYGINDINVTDTFTAENFVVRTDKNVSLGGAVLNNSVVLDDDDVSKINANIELITSADVNISTVDVGDKNLSITASGIYTDTGIDVSADKFNVNVHNDVAFDLNVSDLDIYTDGHNADITNVKNLNISRASAQDLSVGVNGYDVTAQNVYVNKLSVTSDNLNVQDSGIAVADLNVSNNVSVENSFNDLTLEGNYTYAGDFNISNGGYSIVTAGSINAENVNFNNVSEVELNEDLNATNSVNITNITGNVTLGGDTTEFDLNSTEMAHINAASLNIVTENNITVSDNVSSNTSELSLSGDSINIDNNLSANILNLTAAKVQGSGNIIAPFIDITAPDINITAQTTSVTVNGGNDQLVINAEGSAYALHLLSNVNNASIKGDTVNLEYNGSGDLNIGTDVNNISIVNNSSDNIGINEADDLNIVSVANGNHSLSVTAGGNITGTSITSRTVTASTDDNVTITGENNDIQTLNVYDANYVSFESNHYSSGDTTVYLNLFNTTPDVYFKATDTSVNYHASGDANIDLNATYFNLNADGNIVVTNSYDSRMYLSMINVGEHNLTIYANSDINNWHDMNYDSNVSMDTLSIYTPGVFSTGSNNIVFNADNININASRIDYDLHTTAQNASFTLTSGGADIYFSNDVNVTNLNVADNNSVSLNVTGDLDLNASATNGDGVNLDITANDVNIYDSLNVDNLTINANAANMVFNNNITASVADIDNSGGNVTINTNMNITDSLDINVSGSVNALNGLISAQSLNINANGGPVDINTNIEALSLSSQGNATVNNISSTANLSLDTVNVHDNNLTVSTGGDLTIDNNLTAQTLSIQAGGDIITPTDLNSSESAVLSAESLNITAANIGSESLSVKIDTPKATLVSTDDNGTVNVASERSVDLDGVAFTGQGDDKNLIVTVNGDLNITDNALDINTSVNASADNISVDSALITNDLTLNADGNISLGQVDGADVNITAQSVNVSGTVDAVNANISAGNVVLSDRVDVNTLLEIESNMTDLILPSITSYNGNVNIENNGKVTIAGEIDAAGHVTVTAQNSDIVIAADVGADTVTLQTDPQADASSNIVGNIVVENNATIYADTTLGTGLTLTAHSIGDENASLIYEGRDNAGNVVVTLGAIDEESKLYLESNVTSPAFDPTDEDAGWIKFNKTNNPNIAFDSDFNAVQADEINDGVLDFDAVKLNSIRYVSSTQNAQDIAELQNDVADLYNKYNELEAEIGDLFDSNNTVSKYISYMIWGTDSIDETNVSAYFEDPLSLSGLNSGIVGSSQNMDEINAKFDALATFSDTDGNESNGYESVKLTDKVVSGENNVSVDNISDFVSHVAVNNSVNADGELNASYVKGDLDVDSVAAGVFNAQDVNITGTATITQANVESAVVGEANVTTANVELANVDSAVVGEANVTTANVNLANVESAVVDEANVTTANVELANVDRAVVREANVTTVNVETLVAGGANISGMDYNGTINAIADEFNETYQKIAEVNASVAAEAQRAATAEGELNASIIAEAQRAQNAESALDAKITDVNTTLTQRVAADEESIRDEFETVNGRIDEVNASVAAEVQRAQGAEDELASAIENEAQRAQNTEATLAEQITDVNTSLSNEVARATGAEEELAAAVDSEAQRAQNAESALDAKITDVNTTLTQRVAADESNFENTKAEFETVTSELNTTLQYNVARLDAMADYKADGKVLTLDDYKVDTSVFSSPDLVIELKETVDATNAKANDEALGSVQEDTDALENEQETGSLFVDFFKKLFGSN